MEFIHKDFHSIFGKLKWAYQKNDKALCMHIDMLASLIDSYFTVRPGTDDDKVADHSEMLVILSEIFSLETYTLLMEILVNSEKKVDDYAIRSCGKLFATIPKYFYFTDTVLRFGIIGHIINTIIEGTPVQSVSCLRILANFCINNEKSQNHLVESEKVGIVFKKFIELALADQDHFALFNKGPSYEETGPFTIKNIIYGNDEIRTILINEGAIDLAILIIEKKYSTSPSLALNCVSLLDWFSEIESLQHQIACKLFPVYKIISLDKTQDLEENEKKDILNTCIFELTEFLLQKYVNACDLFYDCGAFYKLVAFIDQVTNSIDDSEKNAILDKMCDLAVLTTLADSTVNRIYENQQDLNTIKRWLSSKNIILSSSAALLLGNISRSPDRSERFVIENCHNIIIDQLTNVFKNYDVLNNTNVLLAFFGCLKNLLLPIKVQKIAITNGNIAKFMIIVENTLSLKNPFISLKIVVLIRLLSLSNPVNISHMLFNSEVVQNFLDEFYLKGSSSGIDFELIRFVMNLSIFNMDEVSLEKYFPMAFFEYLDSTNLQLFQTLFIDFTNFLYIAVLLNKEEIISKFLKTNLPERVKSFLLMPNVILPALVAALSFLTVSITWKKKELAEECYERFFSDDNLKKLLLSYLNIQDETVKKLVQNIINTLNDQEQLKKSIL